MKRSRWQVTNTESYRNGKLQKRNLPVQVTMKRSRASFSGEAQTRKRDLSLWGESLSGEGRREGHDSSDSDTLKMIRETQITTDEPQDSDSSEVRLRSMSHEIDEPCMWQLRVPTSDAADDTAEGGNTAQCASLRRLRRLVSLLIIHEHFVLPDMYVCP